VSSAFRDFFNAEAAEEDAEIAEKIIRNGTSRTAVKTRRDKR